MSANCAIDLLEQHVEELVRLLTENWQRQQAALGDRIAVELVSNASEPACAATASEWNFPNAAGTEVGVVPRGDHEPVSLTRTKE